METTLNYTKQNLEYETYYSFFFSDWIYRMDLYSLGDYKILYRIYDVDVVWNNYSCDVCCKDFQTKEDLIKDPSNNYFMICSKKCEFKYIFHLIKREGYSQQNLKLMLRIIDKTLKDKEFNEHLAIYELTKHYQNFSLSNIKHLVPSAKDECQAPRNTTKCQVPTKPPLYNRGLALALARSSTKCQTKNLALPDHKGDITKWF